MASGALAVTAFYRCYAEVWRVSIDERMSSWVFAGENQILKIGYDVAWQDAGGVVGTPRYQSALDMMGSVILTVSIGGGGTIEVIDTPANVLAATVEGWLQCTGVECPCPLVPGGYSALPRAARP
jgi:hypothetical protein